MKTDGTLYLIRHKNIETYTKIGFTRNLEKRIKSLQTASPTGIEVIYSINTKYADRLEKHLHNKYKFKNTHLEWFNLNHEDIVEIIFYVEEIVNKRNEK